MRPHLSVVGEVAGLRLSGGLAARRSGRWPMKQEAGGVVVALLTGSVAQLVRAPS